MTSLTKQLVSFADDTCEDFIDANGQPKVTSLDADPNGCAQELGNCFADPDAGF